MTDTVKLPDDWRQKAWNAIDGNYTDEAMQHLAALLESWRVPDAAALPTPPAEASRAEVADLLEEADAVSMNVEDIYEHFAQWLTERCVITRREATDG